MDRERMKKIARFSDGKYYNLHEFTTVVDYLSGSAKPRQIPVEEEQDDLWDNIWVLLFFTAVIAAEWILRKAVKLL